MPAGGGTGLAFFKEKEVAGLSCPTRQLLKVLAKILFVVSLFAGVAEGRKGSSQSFAPVHQGQVMGGLGGSRVWGYLPRARG